jgi:hypothetical protein
VETVKRLYEALHRKRPEIWHNDLILYRDKAAAHKAASVKKLLDQKSISEMERTSYSLIWLHMTSGCFQKQFALKGQRFQDVGDVQKV